MSDRARVVAKRVFKDHAEHHPSPTLGQVLTVCRLNGIIEYHLDEIAAWRGGLKASPGCSADGERYALRMRLAIRKHEQQLIALGHRPTIDHVARHGFCDGKFSEPE